MSPVQPVRDLLCGEVATLELATLREPWNALVFATARPNPFLSWEWLQTWIETAPIALRRRVLTVWSGNELVGAAPLSRNGETLRLLGVPELAADYTDVLALPGTETAAVDALAGAICLKRQWSQFIIGGLVPGALVEQLIKRLKKFARIEREPCSFCPVLDLASNWEDDPRFDRKRWYKIQRKMSMAAERHGLNLRCVDTVDEVPGAVETLFRLHKEHKAFRQIQTDSATERVAEFHRRAAVRFQADGWLILDLVVWQGEPVAAFYGFRFGSRFCLYQTGLAGRGATLGVGTLALASRLANSAAEWVYEFDFLRGAGPHKALWAATNGPVNVAVIPFRPSQQCYAHQRDHAQDAREDGPSSCWTFSRS